MYRILDQPQAANNKCSCETNVCLVQNEKFAALGPVELILQDRSHEHSVLESCIRSCAWLLLDAKCVGCQAGI